ncbi:hypothetical protein DI270_032980 [Microbispora triticiradicis]|uniref:Aminoacyl-transfer RNA synthetases class-II family profile domain-containing protein n=1 Tax=Microbispora triticiradicis TaxID=2200763 RepID=A0ABX9L9T5_9ACTN|nr:hypothetical protein [Microbispora triticiradicis]RGA00716.1 hypothetical protein DI270_032980 [Microbispora triticiradicis]GLW21373.1 hypothetical protein Mame01_14160 [Microbispora amethystogenes]
MTGLSGSRIAGGLAILGPEETALLRLLDDTFRRWAVEEGGGEISAPPIYPVDELANFDVYVNFPHLALVAGDLRAPVAGPAGGRFSPEQIAGPHLGLPTATCFGAYLYYRDRTVPADTLVTLVNRCFRGESHFDGLRRLLTFQMREIVAIGSYEHTQDVIARYRTQIEELLGALSLDVTVEAASDPFFQRDGARALLQRMQPVKYEFQVDDLAIASVNTHRNFFGERCRIGLEPDGGTAFTGCVAFGLERWVSVLVGRYGSAGRAHEKVEQALRERQLV